MRLEWEERGVLRGDGDKLIGSYESLGRNFGWAVEMGWPPKRIIVKSRKQAQLMLLDEMRRLAAQRTGGRHGGTR